MKFALVAAYVADALPMLAPAAAVRPTTVTVPAP